ncbi:sugar phosphate isomerase/epimerase family protein [Paenibacillus methanolicus]|uniref:Sugar phosphate isomerase/epimerase n=1 Tax=Paenibacillus methanolicus TaxID=582686 RepID=A0A5S5CL97_9BACL|nr:TIM barrel protein [Paenibacillus methanolicus]TYP79485.1 sugar phosphate isomerase/epimerase [Paenibacillus methanolicus]
MAYLSVSTWSLHRLLGPLRWTYWDEQNKTQATREELQPQEIELLDLPAEAGKRGYRALEICHFHFPSTDEEFLRRLKLSFDRADMLFDTLLLDYGDLTSPDEARRASDLAWMKRWIGIGADCGARRIRIIAGEADASDHAALRQSAKALSELAEFGRQVGIQVVSENFKALTIRAVNGVELVRNAEGKLGYITDFGNYRGEGKFEEIAMTAPLSQSVHVKAQDDSDGRPDADELRRCLDVAHRSGFDGAYVLIYDGPGDMWQGLERLQPLVEPYVAGERGAGK